MKFIATVWLAVFAGANPVSTLAEPACTTITRNPATSTQTRLMEVVLSATALATSSILGGAAVWAKSAGAASTSAAPARVQRDFAVMCLLEWGTACTGSLLQRDCQRRRGACFPL